ncbi:Ropn1, partial [Acrasis kona]
GKHLIRDRKKRGLKDDAPVDKETLKEASKFFEERQESYVEKSKRWLTLDQVKSLYDHVNKTRMINHANNSVSL